MKYLWFYSLFVILFISIISFTSAITYSPQLSNPTINLSSPQIHNAQQSYNFNVTLTSYEDPWVITTINITEEGPYRGMFVWKNSIGDIDNDGINEIMASDWDRKSVV